MFKLENFLLTQYLSLIPREKQGRKQNSVWGKQERDIFEIGNFLLKYFFEKRMKIQRKRKVKLQDPPRRYSRACT